MSLLSDGLTGLLKQIYPGVAFDAAGLSRLLLPILIALIAAVTYFPVSLSQAGDFAADQIEQRLPQTQDSMQDGVTDADSAQ